MTPINRGDETIRLAQAIKGMDESISMLTRADHAQAALQALAKLAMDQQRQLADLARAVERINSFLDNIGASYQATQARLAGIERELSSARGGDSVVM